MNFAIVGNNDGPLRLLRSVYKVGLLPAFVGLQKPVDETLRKAYLTFIEEARFYEGFDESGLIQIAAPYSLDLLINCFCNFRFKKILELYPTLNVHPSPLPKYRGRHPMHWALINDEKEFGITLHQMIEEIDAGDIYWQRMIKLDEGMSVAELRNRLLDLVEEEFGRFLEDFLKGEIKAMPNPRDQATYVTRRFPRDSQLTDWSTNRVIYCKVMALRSESNPAFFMFNSQQVQVFSAELVNKKYVGFSAPLVCEIHADGATIICEDGSCVRLSGFDPFKYNIKINEKIPL
ncbi:MAG TPA: formyltransferase family protein [Candidatus Limnocylindrales bacterium]|nr:formyltransferase family protein [Candidatus Limnocylindrales bacterium]